MQTGAGGAVQATIRRTTIADVAKAAGVSKTAVSFAFNAPDRLSSDTVTHIHEIATAMGYRPDPVARSLAQRENSEKSIATRILLIFIAHPQR